MVDIEHRLHDLAAWETIATQRGPLQRRGAEVKIIVTLVYIIAVVSLHPYDLAGLLSLAALPVAALLIGDLPVRRFAAAILIVSPFAILVGIVNPFLDASPIELAPGLVLRGGWVSFVSILGRFVLTMTAALTLVATTGFYRLCGALVTLKVPRALAVQLMLLYRYIFVLAEDTIRLVRARNLRGFGRKGRGLVPTGALIGALLLRTLDRARRIHTAMCARGFDGSVPVGAIRRTVRTDVFFVAFSLAAVIVLRFVDPAGVLP